MVAPLECRTNMGSIAEPECSHNYIINDATVLARFHIIPFNSRFYVSDLGLEAPLLPQSINSIYSHITISYRTEPRISASYVSCITDNVKSNFEHTWNRDDIFSLMNEIIVVVIIEFMTVIVFIERILWLYYLKKMNASVSANVQL